MDELSTALDHTTGVTPFHTAFPAHNLVGARHFYGGLLGCPEGRKSDTWIEFNPVGHQIVAHYKPTESGGDRIAHHNPVDGHDVPVPHLGVVLTMPLSHSLARRLQAAGASLLIEPYIRVRGQSSEQATMFSLDSSDNALDFKAFADMRSLFAT